MFVSHILNYFNAHLRLISLDFNCYYWRTSKSKPNKTTIPLWTFIFRASFQLWMFQQLDFSGIHIYGIKYYCGSVGTCIICSCGHYWNLRREKEFPKKFEVLLRRTILFVGCIHSLRYAEPILIYVTVSQIFIRES